MITKLKIKNFSLVLLFSALLIGQWGLADQICGKPEGNPKICAQMSNLRSHIMVLEAQRDLLQLNYPLFKTVARSLAQVSTDTVKTLPAEFAAHADIFTKLSSQAQDVAKFAEVSDSRALNIANNLRTSCASCHTQSGGSSGKKWDEIFKADWNKITEKSNTPGRNPFPCKQMHGLISNYSYILTAYLTQEQNYEMIEAMATEMARIANLLVENRIVHGRLQAIQDVALRSALVVELAKKKDPAAFTKAYETVESCMNCHTSLPNGNQETAKFKLNSWK